MSTDATPSAGTARPRSAAAVSVIIVSFNGRHHLARCLPSVLADDALVHEVIVVDNGSSDGTLPWLAEHFPTVRVLALGANLGFGVANMRGVEAAHGRYVALLNNDTEVEPGWLAPMVRAVQGAPEVAAACSTLVLLDTPEVLNARGGGMTWLGYGFDRDFMRAAAPAPGEPERPETEEVLFPTAAAMLMERDELLAVGGFDPAIFMYHEDVDLGWRLWLLGRRVVVCRDSVVRHRFGGTSLHDRGHRWREHLGMRHNLRTLLKHYRPKVLARACVGIARVWWHHRAVRQAVHVAAWNLAHLPATLGRRREIQRRRTVDDLELLDRGLISPAGFPPADPVPPACRTPADAIDCVAGTSLLPGEDSSSSRLGWGWYRRERENGRWRRWTCGDARCFLRSTPGAAGRLVVAGRLPEGVGGRIAVLCNGEAVEHTVPGGAFTVSLDAAADAAGVLDLRILSPRWVPHEVRRDWDFRSLGCAVERVTFTPRGLRTGGEQPLVSVVVPTFNRCDALLRTLDALVTQSWSELEIIVVDDGSTDDTWDRLQGWSAERGPSPAVVTLRQDNAGPGTARNLAVSRARGELVLFLGDDTCPAPDLVERHVEAHRALAEPCAVVGFTDWDRERMRVTPFLEYVNRFGAQFGYALFTDGADIPFTCLYTSNLSLPAAVFGVERFDTCFSRAAWEDAELGCRLSRRGLRIVYCAAARTSHHHPTTMGRFLARQRIVGAEAETIYALHPELAASDVMPPFAAPRWLAIGRLVLPLLAPLLATLDGLGVPLPHRLYRGAVLWAYFTGRRRRPRAAGSSA